MVLRYSAGATGTTTRKIEVDGAVLVAKQVFPSTGNWSTWSTVGIEQTFSAGAHTLTVLFDSPSALIYEPQSDGDMVLVGLEYIQDAATWENINGKGSVPARPCSQPD